ncbi:MAG TPA: 6-bladed beta-propeller [Terriglobales bacterium]|nr:6-bladed beta-propeller [Terriglobales bacterium]
MKKFHKTLISTLLGIAALWMLPQPAAAKDKQQPAAPTNLVWPLPPDKPRLKFLEMITNNFDVEPKKKLSWVDKMVGNADPNIPETFERATGVAADSKGRVFVVSAQRQMLYIISKEKHEVIRVRGDRGLVFKTPLGVVVDSQDNFYVADASLASVMKFDSQAHLQAAIGSDAGLKNPTFLALDEGRRRLFVVDSHLHQVLIFNLDTLQLESTVGKRGEKPGQFNYPVGIAVGPDGSFAVTDTGSCSVEVFTADLKFVRRIGRQGTRAGEFVRPKGIAYDSEGHIWVVDSAFNNVQIFNPDGKLLMFVGSHGQNAGEFSVPVGIYIDKKNRVYISDNLNARVQIFQFLGGN